MNFLWGYIAGLLTPVVVLAFFFVGAALSRNGDARFTLRRNGELVRERRWGRR